MTLKPLHTQRHENSQCARVFFPGEWGAAVDWLWAAGRRQVGFFGYLGGLAVGEERDLGKRV